MSTLDADRTKLCSTTTIVELCNPPTPVYDGRRHLKEMSMRLALIALLLPLALAGCVTFSSSDPPPPRDNTTVVTPAY